MHLKGQGYLTNWLLPMQTAELSKLDFPGMQYVAAGLIENGACRHSDNDGPHSVARTLEDNRRQAPASLRISVLFPKRDSIRSTATSAVRLR